MNTHIHCIFSTLEEERWEKTRERRADKGEEKWAWDTEEEERLETERVGET